MDRGIRQGKNIKPKLLRGITHSSMKITTADAQKNTNHIVQEARKFLATTLFFSKIGPIEEKFELVRQMPLISYGVSGWSARRIS